MKTKKCPYCNHTFIINVKGELIRLKYLKELSKNELSITELSRIMKVNPPSSLEMIEKMIKEKLVFRDKKGKQYNEKKLYLTLKGKKIVRDLK